jgi:hypothetical protein
MKNFKRVCFNTVALTVMAAGVAMTADSAQALSISFAPTGAVGLDADPIVDILASGSTITFDVLLETYGLPEGDDVNQVGFNISFDGLELIPGVSGFYSPVLGSLVSGPTVVSTGAPFTNSFNFIQGGFAAARQQANILLGKATFNLGNLNNDGKADFQTFMFSAIHFTGTQPHTLSSILSAQQQQVEVQPVPTPALLPGLVGLGMAAWRKRKSKEGEAA